MVSHNQDDVVIQRLIDTAVALCEARTKRYFRLADVVVVAQIYQPFWLPRLPYVEDLALSVKDTDDVYVPVEAGDYNVDTVQEQLTVKTYKYKNIYQISYVAGYTESNPLPTELKQAVLYELAILYENRNLNPALELSPATAKILMPYINPHYL